VFYFVFLFFLFFNVGAVGAVWEFGWVVGRATTRQHSSADASDTI
jgi:hypothetical protein